LVRPIVILGSPRSGTTLLARILGAHPDVALVGEPRLVWRYGNDKLSDELTADHARADVVDHIHAAFVAMLAEQGKPRLVEKTPANAVRPSFVDAVCPDARFVHITRDGWGAVPSMATFWGRRATGLDAKQRQKAARRLREADWRQLPHYAGELLRRLPVPGRGRHEALYGPRVAGLQEVADEHGKLVASAVQWQACVERSSAYGRNHVPDRYLEVKLEELDEAAITRVVDFCELHDGDAVVQRFVEQYDPAAARRRGELSAEQRASVEPFVGPSNAWLGYPP
jgi:hypothetical protein